MSVSNAIGRSPHMFWFIDAGDHAAASAVRSELLDRLRTHAVPQADLASAAIVIGELVTNAVEHGRTDVCVEFRWNGAHPRFSVHDAGAGFDHDEFGEVAVDVPNGRGLRLASTLARCFRATRRPGGGMTVEATLDVTRARRATHRPRVAAPAPAPMALAAP